jgi:WXG100 family type VII secretion target
MSDPTEVRVDKGVLESAASDLTAQANVIRRHLQHLEDGVAPLRRNWTGETKAQYAQCEKTIKEAMVHISHIIAKFGATVHEICGTQMTNELNMADDFRSAGIRGLR